MKNYSVQIRVRFKDGILDPQSEAIATALKRLNFKSVAGVRVDKIYVVELQAENENQAAQLGREMANKILANVVMENFEVEVLG